MSAWSSERKREDELVQLLLRGVDLGEHEEVGLWKRGRGGSEGEEDGSAALLDLGSAFLLVSVTLLRSLSSPRLTSQSPTMTNSSPMMPIWTQVQMLQI